MELGDRVGRNDAAVHHGESLGQVLLPQVAARADHVADPQPQFRRDQQLVQRLEGNDSSSIAQPARSQK